MSHFRLDVATFCHHERKADQRAEPAGGRKVGCGFLGATLQEHMERLWALLVLSQKSGAVIGRALSATPRALQVSARLPFNSTSCVSYSH